ncbi:MAG: carboxymuconolactone decarboxylase family protein [Alphaproteobacteria bacterium]|nr:carboxymuconolactone decarboxylase family protein [Alphaproteobacteria bacterium]
MTLQSVSIHEVQACEKEFKQHIPDYAKDIRLNWGSVLSAEGAADLSQEQLWGVALASAFATKNHTVTQEVKRLALEQGLESLIVPAQAAAAIMAMNNVYYRSIHLLQDDELKKMPAKLRMNIMANPGIAKLDFEVMCLGVSAINGCGMCLEAHAHEVKKAGLSTLGIQSVLRLASVIHAAAFAISIS